MTVPGGDEHVAIGACVQAAAVLHERPAELVAEAWGLGDGVEVEPRPRVDRESLRARYAAVRDGTA